MHLSTTCHGNGLLVVVVTLVTLVTSDRALTSREGDTSTPQPHAVSCVREPVDNSERKPGDHGFRIKILGQPSPAFYTPGQVYTISLNGTYPNQKLVGFMLVAVPRYAQDESTTLGFFQHIDSVKTRFAEKCPHIVTNVYRHYMAGVDVLWMAPPSGTGCVEFRAMVLEDRGVWYRDDGALTLVFCEDKSGDKQQSVNDQPECGACGVAKYQMTLHGLWSKETHPKDFPMYQRLLHWSAALGASHSRQYSIWRYGDYASEAVRDMCEFGYTFALERDMKKNSGAIRTAIKMPGVWWSERQTLTTSRWARFSVDRNHPLLSFVSMFGPSPDWCIGVSALNLCLANDTWANEMTVALYPWDAGTDDGDTYLATNVKSEPQQRIHRLTNTYPSSSPFVGREPVRPMAMLTLQRIHSRHDDVTSDCDDKRGTDTGAVDDDRQQGDRASPETGGDESVTNAVDDYSNTLDGDDVKPLLSPSDMDKNKTKVDSCAVTPWGDWSQCSVTCDWGFHQRERHFVDPLADRKKCTRISLNEVEKCQGNQIECQQAECLVGAWSPWSECSVTCRGHGEGQQTRSRHYVHAIQGGRQCSIHLTETQTCGSNDDLHLPQCSKIGSSAEHTSPQSMKLLHHHHNGDPTPADSPASAVDCVMSEWTKWTQCPSTCGDAQRTRRRHVIREPENGGKECPERREMRRPCKTRPCSVSACEMGPWSEWTRCTGSCGSNHVQERTRAVHRESKHHDVPCGPRLERRYCILPACPDTRPRLAPTYLSSKRQ